MNSREFTYEELIEFIDELRQHGYRISTEQYIAVQRLLVALVASGNTLENSPSFGKLLAPILCTSPEEQKSFYRLFDQWLTYQPVLLSNIERKTRHTSSTSSSPDQRWISALSWSWLLSVFRTWPRKLKFIAISLSVATILILILGGGILLKFLIPSSTTTQTQAALSGMIVDDVGQPISNARIQFPGGVAYSDANGYFRLTLLPQEAPIQLTIDHPGYQGRSVVINEATQPQQIQLPS